MSALRMIFTISKSVANYFRSFFPVEAGISEEDGYICLKNRVFFSLLDLDYDWFLSEPTFWKMVHLFKVGS